MFKLSTISAAGLVLINCADVGPFRAGELASVDAGSVDRADADQPDALLSPVKLAVAEGGPATLAVTDSYVYWGTQLSASIGRIDTDGSGQVESTSAQGDVIALGAEGSDVYWLTYDGSTGSLFGLGDSVFANQPRTLAGDVPDAFDLSITSDDVYYVSWGIGDNADLGSLNRVSRANGSPQALRTAEQAAHATASTSASVYWSTWREVHRAPLGNPSDKQTLAFDQGTVASIAAAGDRVCWTSQLDPEVESFDIWCSKQSTNQRIAQGLTRVYDLEITDTHAYWCVERTQSTGDLVRHRFADGATDALAEGAPQPLDIAVDSRFVFWIEADFSEGTGAIWRRGLTD